MESFSAFLIFHNLSRLWIQLCLVLKLLSASPGRILPLNSRNVLVRSLGYVWPLVAQDQRLICPYCRNPEFSVGDVTSLLLGPFVRPWPAPCGPSRSCAGVVWGILTPVTSAGKSHATNHSPASPRLPRKVGGQLPVLLQRWRSCWLEPMWHQTVSGPLLCSGLMQTPKNRRLCFVKYCFFCSPWAFLAPPRIQFQMLHVTAWKLGSAEDSAPLLSVLTTSSSLGTCGSNYTEPLRCCVGMDGDRLTSVF